MAKRSSSLGLCRTATRRYSYDQGKPSVIPATISYSSKLLVHGMGKMFRTTCDEGQRKRIEKPETDILVGGTSLPLQVEQFTD